MADQTLILDTIAGPREITAPAGWNFDRTAISVWAALIRFTRDSMKPQKRARDGYVLAGKIGVLSNILANVLGMAEPYWEQQARDAVRKEADRG